LSSSPLRAIANFPKSTSVAGLTIAFLALTSASTLTSTESPALTVTLDIVSDPVVAPALILVSATSFPSMYR
jgi:hypothetical protein